MKTDTTVRISKCARNVAKAEAAKEGMSMFDWLEILIFEHVNNKKTSEKI